MNYLVAESRHGGMARGILLLSGIHIVMSLILSKTHGLHGIAFALALEFVLLALCVAISASHHSGLSFLRIIRLSFASPVLLGAVLVLPLHEIVRAIDPENYLEIVATGAVVFFPLSICAGFILLDRGTRTMLLERFRTMLPSRSEIDEPD